MYKEIHPRFPSVYMHACSMTTQNHVVLQIVHTTSCSLLVDPLQVVQHPMSQSVATGVDVSFRVEASGDRIKLQWQKDGREIYDLVLSVIIDEEY